MQYLKQDLKWMWLASVMVMCSCSSDEPAGTPADVSVDDASSTDTLDEPDTISLETVSPDTDSPDTALSDTDSPDTAVSDTDSPDTESPDTESSDTESPDTGPSDTGPEDVASDVMADAADNETDSGPLPDTSETDTSEPACPFPEPALGTAPAAVALAQNAAACGQTEFAWQPVDDMGTVLDTESAGSIPAVLLSLAVQEVGATLPRDPEHDVALTKVLYRTQDRGEPIEATTLVARPIGVDPGSLDVMLVLHGTAGFNDDCAPSDKLEGAALAALFASWGYLVVAPDFIGLKSLGEPTGFLHPYLVGQATAIASLDAVRAAGRMEPEALDGLCATPRTLVFGGSQGGHAALWVDRLQPYYAAELELLGTVATTPPSDELGQVERALTEVVSATGNTIAMVGTNAGWYDLSLGDVLLSPYDEQLPVLLAESCSPKEPEGVETLEDLFQPALLEAASAGELAQFGNWGCVLTENGLTTTSVERLGPSEESYGILFVTSGADTLVHPPIEQAAAATLCEQGMPIEYLECAGAGHVEGSFWSLGETLAFLEARQAGEAFTAPCEVTAPVVCSGTPAQE